MTNEYRDTISFGNNQRHFKSYHAYKTDTERGGHVPESWMLPRLKWIAKLIYGDSLALETREAGEVPVYGSNGVVGRHSRAITLAPVIIIGRKGSSGKLNFVEEPCFPIDTAYFIDSHSTSSDLRWLFYAMQILNLDEFAEDSAVPGLSRDLVHGRTLPLPLVSEQRSIAEFLDRETGKIDALVAKKEELIELLQEKRIALITHAVTKGLDPNAPMKDSGIEWLGENPAHWDLAKTVYRYEVQLGKMLDQSRITEDNMYPYLRVFDVQWGKINTDDLPMMDFSPRDQEKFRLEAGDLIVNEGGSYVGRSAIWNGQLGNCFYQKALHRVRARSDRDSTRFLYYLMHFATKQGVFVAGGNQTTIDHLTAEQLNAYKFAFPPFKEQVAIADYLDQKEQELDRLIHRVEDASSKLKELRTALISAAVTGKIDVREEVP